MMALVEHHRPFFPKPEPNQQKSYERRNIGERHKMKENFI
jgi:hypothetical protein